MNKDKWVKHIIKKGSRFHVLYWDSKGRHCSEANCEINKPIPVGFNPMAFPVEKSQEDGRV